jgi:hypothetical protein
MMMKVGGYLAAAVALEIIVRFLSATAELQANQM